MTDPAASRRAPERLRPWLALLHAPGVGSRTFLELLERCGEPAQILAASAAQRQAWGLTPKLSAYLAAPDWAAVEADLRWLDQPDCHLLLLSDPDYPKLLRQIADPPPLLFVRGDPGLLNHPQLAVVGSRNPTRLGAETAHQFAAFLTRSGLTITSGLAIGIDGAAHRGALEGGGGTVAVMGSGPDRIYPASHRELAHQIVQRGALISEFPPGVSPLPGNFPRRNRIISGLSVGTLVVEAARGSGSLITARLASEQGREVFAIPGSIHNPLARGCHALIREGAKLVETAQDVVEELAALLGGLLHEATAPAQSAPANGAETDPPAPQWDADYQRLLTALGYDPTPIDRLIEHCGLTADAVSSMLFLLELEGYVSSLPGGRYCLTGKLKGTE